MLRLYFSTSLLARILGGFVLGILGGLLCWWLKASGSGFPVGEVLAWISPLGDLLVNMLKMIVIPVIFFSIICGSAAIPVQKLGSVGLYVLLWYLGCSLIAALTGIAVATTVDPGSNAAQWESLLSAGSGTATELVANVPEDSGLGSVFLSMFENPFLALSAGNFLAIIVFSMAFGIALRVLIDSKVKSAKSLLDILDVCKSAVFKMVDWIMEYMPIGVFALSVANFATYGPAIAGPYVQVALGVIAAVFCLVFLVYPLLLWIATRKNPYAIIKEMEQPMLTAFITRSSAAALPVSIRALEENLGVKNELASFSLPLGATINMDGVCVHLPMFAVLATHLFGVDLSATDLFLMVVSTVFASIGAGGVPGGSVMLLFMILQGIGLTTDQIAVVVGLALGINPILDMFETANNVTGDMVGTYAVGSMTGMVDEPVASED